MSEVRIYDICCCSSTYKTYHPLTGRNYIGLTQFVLEKFTVAATQVLLSPRCIHAMCSTICSSLLFLFPRFHVASISFFHSEKEPKPRAVDLEKWTLITLIPRVSTVWGRGRDGFVWGPEAEPLSLRLPHFQGDKFQWPKALCRRFADRPSLLTQFSLAFLGYGFFALILWVKDYYWLKNSELTLVFKCDLVSGINFTGIYKMKPISYRKWWCFLSFPQFPVNKVRNVMKLTSLMVAKCFEIPEWKGLYKQESFIRIIIIANCTGTI